MDSSVALIQAASGLEPLMAGSSRGVIQDNTVAKVSALLYYQASVVSKLTKNKAFINKFNKTIYDQIALDFGLYIDAKARMQPKSFHHIYEWNKTGRPSGRLFTTKKINSDGLGFKVSYDFKQSKSLVPTKKGKHRHVFANKAMIMESGKPVVIKPRNSERLVFDVNGYTVFMPKGQSVIVNKPGGAGVKNSFKMSYQHFFKSQLVNESIKKSNFQSLFSSSMNKVLKAPISIKKIQYKFSANELSIQADTALTAAFGGGVL